MSDIPPRRSRFDLEDDDDGPSVPGKPDRKRSRSPQKEISDELRRDRSPVATPQLDRAAAIARAQAAAAKINASIAARGIQHATAPVRVEPPVVKRNAAPKDDVFEQDGDFVKEYDINDLRVRYTLTKAPVMKKIGEDTGCDISTRGEYFPNRALIPTGKQPLHLRITSTSRANLDKATATIEEMMSQELPNLIDERRLRRRDTDFERDAQGRRKWPEESIPIDLEPIPGFNLRATVVGTGGANVKHIQQETGCRVQIKGQGSGFLEQDTNMESEKAMYLHVSGPQPETVQAAKALCLELLAAVRRKYVDFKEGRGEEAGSGGDQESHRGWRGGDFGRRGGYRGGRATHDLDYPRGGRSYDNLDAPKGRDVGALNYDNVESVAGSTAAEDSADRGMFTPGTADYGAGNPVAQQTGYPATMAAGAAPQHTGYDTTAVLAAAAAAPQTGYDALTTAAAAAAGYQDVAVYQAWVNYYATNPQADGLAGQGGYDAYWRSVAAYHQSLGHVPTSWPVAQGYPSTYPTPAQGTPSNTTYAYGYAPPPQAPTYDTGPTTYSAPVPDA